MNTSRDIEKLFDHFGGNAGDYQEIGRENEAKNARTRWPLLATLDFAQPTIPEIAPRREAQSIARAATEQQQQQQNPASGEAGSTPALTPINRGKPPLFARTHRRTIPPVNANPSVDALRATRFSALADATPQTPATADIPPVAPAQRATQPPTAESGSALASAAAAIARANSTALSQADAPSASILGKLFDKPKPAPASDSLNSLFDRLRATGDAPKSDTANRPAPTWGSRS